jgi:hypothetical protein
MLTCYIRNDWSETSKIMSVYSILLIPITFLCYAICIFVKILKHKRVKYNKDLQFKMIRYLIYSLIYLVFYSPSIVLYILTINQEKYEKNTFLSWYIYICTILNISVNLILSLFRIFEGYLTFPRFLKFFFLWNDSDSVSDESLLNESGFMESMSTMKENERLEILQRKRNMTRFSTVHLDNMKDVHIINLVQSLYLHRLDSYVKRGQQFNKYTLYQKEIL